MKVFNIPMQNGLSELEYLEQIHHRVKLNEMVKFNGKVYIRTTPKNNKYYKSPYHFYLAVKDIYSGNVLIRDSEGELVNSICEYKIEIGV